MNRKILLSISIATACILIVFLAAASWYYYNPTGKIKIISTEGISEIQLDGTPYKIGSNAEVSIKPGTYNLSTKAKDSDADDFNQTVLVEKDKTTEVTVIFSPNFDDSNDPELSIY